MLEKRGELLEECSCLEYTELYSDLQLAIYSDISASTAIQKMTAKKTLSPIEPERREPTQERALRTIDTIFIATAQIVEEEGAAALNTNKIAARAGFSIGTLYQYFPSKEAILLALIDRQRSRVLERISKMLLKAEQSAQNPRALMAEFMHILVQAFGSGKGGQGSQKMQGAMIRLAWQMDHHDKVTHAMREAADRIALYLARMAAQHPQLQLRSSPAAMFVVVRAVMGVIRSASLERSAWLGTPEFEAELQRLAWGMLVDAPQGRVGQ
jgi:AcrR family transcriptional regulator